MFARQRAGLQAPRPILLAVAGTIHARLAAEAEDVLHWDDRGVGHRLERGADQRPRRIVGIGQAEVLARQLALVVLRGLVPAARGVVVVRAADRKSVV